MENLKPCPCCGSEAILLEDRQQWGDFLMKGWLILCMACSCGASNTNKEALVKDWNSRCVA